MLEQNCAGEPVDLCLPFARTEVREASVEPPMLPVGDFALSATISVSYVGCGDDAPGVVQAELSARYLDAVEGTRILPLGIYQDDEGDGLIEVETVNPFLRPLPAEEEITLRFVTRAGASGCVSEPFEIAYRTGPLFDPDD